MTDALPALPWSWDGESLVPATPHWARRADQLLVVGQTYVLEERLDRSANSHRHFFACVRELWQSLPERMTERFPTAEHLRKHALIQTGYRDERSIACDSKAEALRVAAFMRPMDEYALVVARDAVVTVLTAKTQNYRAMDRKTFGESKTAVLEYLSDLIGVSPAAIQAVHDRRTFKHIHRPTGANQQMDEDVAFTVQRELARRRAS